ncbi:T9SS type A sorting domain-containing protein [Brumimicrobium mesophilum]|uniref:T9SS type A sorting domain-containing protein n=1 Tax=Brumimicrobium mesophilum TaxID=392717 RepID=UPI000D13F972|nr:T9SS type A sorting domain-containing protein [Brumimicrobium mesophilum]
MKSITIISFLLLSFGSFSQQRGIEVSDCFRYGYENEYAEERFYTMFPGQDTTTYLDTFKIAFNVNKEIWMDWRYVNELSTMYPTFDTIQWFFNDSLLEAQNYTAELGNFHYVSTSSLNNAQIGYYQLRNLGNGSTFYNTNYPVIHVYEEIIDTSNTVLTIPVLDVKFYPNPASGVVNLEITEPIKNGELKIYNLQGELKRSIPLLDLEKKYTCDVSDLNPGIYFFSVLNKENSTEISRKKVVIR